MDKDPKVEQFREWIKEHPLFSMDDVPTGWAAQISTIAIHYADHRRSIEDDQELERLTDPDHDAIQVFRRGCADGYCYVNGKAKGMHTNGGCRCVRHFLQSDVPDSVKSTYVSSVILDAERRNELNIKEQ